MLHKLEQSDENIAALAEAMRVQFALLAYGASMSALNQAGCAAFVEGEAGLQGRGEGVAAWVWGTASRLKRLTNFASQGSLRKKTGWVRKLRAEADTLLLGPPVSLTLLDEGKAWQVAGGEFLQEFYAVFSTEHGLPGALLGRSGRGFGRYDFLREFEKANHEMYVCASCDETRIGTRHKGRLLTDIDHYFPKSIYPHLSIHPFNLVPICHSCNSRIKGSIDPLETVGAARCTPADLVLPYRSAGLAGKSFLAVDLDAWRNPGTPFAVKSRKGDGATALQIQGFARVAKIPERWNNPSTIDEIGETAFRRLSQFLRAQPELLERSDQLLAKVDEFLGILQDENLGRDPFTFPIKWLLAHLAEAAHSVGRDDSPLVSELRKWMTVPKSDVERQMIGARLREVIKD